MQAVHYTKNLKLDSSKFAVIGGIGYRKDRR
jgi:hypothetical protein